MRDASASVQGKIELRSEEKRNNTHITYCNDECDVGGSVDR